MNHTIPPSGPTWTGSPQHHRPTADSDRPLTPFKAGAAGPRRGLWWLRVDAAPDGECLQELHATTRPVHRGTLAPLKGRPGTTAGRTPTRPSRPHSSHTPRGTGLAEVSRQGMSAC